MTKQPWIKNVFFDLLFILSPAYISVLVVILFQDKLLDYDVMPIWMWAFLIVFIDVSHVYSTLFRTYLHQWEFQEYKKILILIPIMVWVLGVLVYSFGAIYFWRILAYIAVFHFVRQQYGFLRLYNRNQSNILFSNSIDSILIYLLTLYPIVYWHVNSPREFTWFVKGDFIQNMPAILENISFGIYILFIIIYIVKEIIYFLKFKYFNIPKNSILVGTGLSWYIGIVAFNNDIIFTITNVVSHGIPYIALIWFHGEKEGSLQAQLKIFNLVEYKNIFKISSLPIFFIFLLFLGYLEEGLWASLHWGEHLELFPIFAPFNKIESKEILTILVPLLTVPQATHYVLDGYIWKLKERKAYWNKLFFS
jgi:hypothetical protein